MQLTDVMATQVVSVSPETKLGDAARRMVESDIGAAVVLDDAGDLGGVITERDLLRCVSDGIDPATPVEQRMTRHVLTAAPDTEIPEAMALMVDGHFRHLPVVNADGHVIGMVSMRDLMAYTSLRLRGGNLGSGDDLDPGRGHRDDLPHAHRRRLRPAPRSSDLPGAPAQERDPLARARHAVDLHLVEPNMKSTWIWLRLMRGSRRRRPPSRSPGRAPCATAAFSSISVS